MFNERWCEDSSGEWKISEPIVLVNGVTPNDRVQDLVLGAKSKPKKWSKKTDLPKPTYDEATLARMAERLERAQANDVSWEEQTRVTRKHLDLLITR